MSLLVTVYALVDPRDEQVRYVGYTKQALNLRLTGHMCDKTGRKKSEWIAELKELGLRPQIIELEKTDMDSSDEMEHKWALYFLEQGANLTNGKYTRAVKTEGSVQRRVRLIAELAAELSKTEELPVHMGNSVSTNALIDRALEIAIAAVREGFLNSSYPAKLGG